MLLGMPKNSDLSIERIVVFNELFKDWEEARKMWQQLDSHADICLAYWAFWDMKRFVFRGDNCCSHSKKWIFSFLQTAVNSEGLASHETALKSLEAGPTLQHSAGRSGKNLGDVCDLPT